MSIYCLVYGETFARSFNVRIQESDHTSDLKKLIKNEKQNAFEDIDADALDLYLVDIEINMADKSPQAPSLSDEFLLGPADLLKPRLRSPFTTTSK